MSTPRRTLRTMLERIRLAAPVLLLLAVAGCEDELNNPQANDCEERLEFQVNETPATVRYFVAVDGSAILESVTYTTPDGDVTTTTFSDECPGGDTDGAIEFCADVEFDEAMDAAIQAEGEVATGGQIGITYTIFHESLPRVEGPISFCTG